jgi:hypothetical protein
MRLRNLLPLGAEACRVAALLPLVEIDRRLLGPGAAVAWARAAGRRSRTRTVAARERLRRVIAAVDRRVPGGANCYRRSLLELALDGGAARTDKLLAGFVAGGGARSGHAWLESHAVPEQRYDAVMAL